MIKTIEDIYRFTSIELTAMDRLINISLAYKSEPIEIISHHIILAGGKSISPLVVILISEMCGYKGENHIKIAVAIEFIHTATLLHDDVIDAGKTRRGKDTVNSIWGNKYAILIGDFLFSQAFKIMVKTKTQVILETISYSSTIVALGEIEQLNYIGNL